MTDCSGSPLFDPIFGADLVRPACDDTAWITTMLEVETALAAAEARIGIISDADAAGIAAAADALTIDPALLGAESIAGGNPVIPLVGMLRDAARAHGVPPAAVHRGATSQDILDTALALILRRAGRIVVDLLADSAGAARDLAIGHRDVVMVARTLGQQALPTTFGLASAGWALDLAIAARDLVTALDQLTIQFGGAAGTLAALAPDGLRVADELADELGLPRATMPWHTPTSPADPDRRGRCRGSRCGGQDRHRHRRHGRNRARRGVGIRIRWFIRHAAQAESDRGHHRTGRGASRHRSGDGDHDHR